MAFGGGDNSDSDNEELAAGQVQEDASSLDDLLDEIDTVLEADAQTFVQGFVQKGGE
ncbi:ubiquitin-like protein Pup [Gleimia hominis]|uniref:ubiquitin-like protein Pup n=1 Tax=Gleimia hominis TaxID=595468 RepID=UPI000C8020E9|nr:ubiquitin-like protein Pup [Gleimia hominis]WIK65391.1 ubiquitin-like protein Pup [Gleimia hominis]